MPRECALAAVADDPSRECPETICAFWQEGGDDLESGCAVERLGLQHHGADVAEFLLSVRRRIEGQV